MSRTYHHSPRWGVNHRFAMGRNDRGYGMSRRGIGEAPGWHVRLHDNRPGRFEDREILRKVAHDLVDMEAVTFPRTGGRKPHVYYT